MSGFKANDCIIYFFYGADGALLSLYFFISSILTFYENIQISNYEWNKLKMMLQFKFEEHYYKSLSLFERTYQN